MLKNIFLFKGKNFNDLDQLNIYSYPTEIISIENLGQISKIIYGHDHGYIINKCKSNQSNEIKKSLIQQYLIDTPVPQQIDDLNIYTTCINGKIIIGLIFDKEDNPFDYKLIFEDLLNEFLNNENFCSFDDEIEIENLLITMFIDIRRFGDEYIDIYPQIRFDYQDSFYKVFLFGIDDVGKTSFVRKIKTGEYEDNYFLPTKKFNIEYLPVNEKGLLAFWDMPGQRIFRSKWVMGVQESNILLYMIDVANQIRFDESKDEFWKIINRVEFTELPLIILCNKIDLLDYSYDNKEYRERLKQEIIDYFELDKLNEKNWKLLFTSIKQNYNIQKVIETIFRFI